MAFLPAADNFGLGYGYGSFAAPANALGGFGSFGSFGNFGGFGEAYNFAGALSGLGYGYNAFPAAAPTYTAPTFNAAYTPEYFGGFGAPVAAPVAAPAFTGYAPTYYEGFNGLGGFGSFGSFSGLPAFGGYSPAGIAPTVAFNGAAAPLALGAPPAALAAAPFAPTIAAPTLAGPIAPAAPFAPTIAAPTLAGPGFPAGPGYFPPPSPAGPGLAPSPPTVVGQTPVGPLLHPTVKQQVTAPLVNANAPIPKDKVPLYPQWPVGGPGPRPGNNVAPGY